MMGARRAVWDPLLPAGTEDPQTPALAWPNQTGLLPQTHTSTTASPLPGVIATGPGGCLGFGDGGHRFEVGNSAPTLHLPCR